MAAAKKAAPAKKADKAAVVVSPFRMWADRPDDAAMSELCAHITSGGHLAGFVGERAFAYVTVLDWIKADKRRTEMYAHAREDRADMLADEIVAIADEQCTMVKADKHGAKPDDEDGLVEVVFDATAVARNKLRVDARKWAAAKLKPKVYGDRTTLAGDAENPLAILTLESIAADPRSRLSIK